LSRRVLVTGGSGFIGTNVIDLLLREQIEVRSIDVQEPQNLRHREIWRSVDVTNASAIEKQVEEFEPNQILHLAANTSLNERHGDSAYSGNITGVQNIISVCAKGTGIDRVVFASSMLVCELGYLPQSDTDYFPNTLYGKSKVQCEKLIRQANVPITWNIVRPTSIWGPWFREPYRRFFEMVQKGRFAWPSQTKTLRTLGYVENTAMQLNAILTAPTSAIDQRTFYLGDSPPVDLRVWAETVRAAFEGAKIRTIPLPVMRLLAQLGDGLKYLGIASPLSSVRLNNMCTTYICDVSPVEALVDRPKITMNEGVRRTIQWMRSTYGQNLPWEKNRVGQANSDD
jgi:nucleoside-diphosphate-sugar epimerase